MEYRCLSLSIELEFIAFYTNIQHEVQAVTAVVVQFDIYCHNPDDNECESLAEGPGTA